METKDLHEKTDGTLRELILLIYSFDQEEMNRVPFEGSWTAGQLAQHIILSCSGFLEMVNGALDESKKVPDLLVERIKDTFLNFDIRMKSPDFVVPPDKTYEKEDVLHSLEDIRLKLLDAIDTLDLTKTCTSFQLPVYGFLTRWEAIHFVLYHTQRHIQQLQNIRLRIDRAAALMRLSQWCH